MADGNARRCAREGCRAWAQRDSAYCVAHRGDARDDEQEPGERRRRAERFAALALAGRHDDLIAATIQETLSVLGGQRSLAIEIGALRLAVRRVIAVELLDGDPLKLSQPLTRLIDTIVRALRAEQSLAADPDDAYHAAVDRYFIEQGWKEPT